MAEEQTESQDISPAAATAENVEAAPVVESAPVESESTQPEEKLIEQSKVNKIVGTAKQEAYDKGKRDALSDNQTQYQPPYAASEQTQAPNDYAQNVDGGNANLSPEQVRQLIADEANKQAALRTVDSFVNKLQRGKEKYSDFDEKVVKLNIGNLPPVAQANLVHFANEMDNTADVMYELANNPVKFANVLNLAGSSPALARDAFYELSASIKQNEDAKAKVAEQKVEKPLDQIQPATTGTDNGSMSISDLRKADWLR